MKNNLESLNPIVINTLKICWIFLTLHNIRANLRDLKTCGRYFPKALDVISNIKSTVKQQTRTNSTPFHCPPSALLDQNTGHVKKMMCTTRSKMNSKIQNRFKAYTNG